MSGTQRPDKETPDPPRPRRWPCRAARVITGLSVFGAASLWWLVFGSRMLLPPLDGVTFAWVDWWGGIAALALLVPLLVVPPVLILALILRRRRWLSWGLINLALVLGILIPTWIESERRYWEAYRQEVDAQPLPPGWLPAPPPGVPEAVE